MQKKRALTDAVKDPVVLKKPSAKTKTGKAHSRRMRDVAIAAASVVIGIIGGILISRLTRIF